MTDPDVKMYNDTLQKALIEDNDRLRTALAAAQAAGAPTDPALDPYERDYQYGFAAGVAAGIEAAETESEVMQHQTAGLSRSANTDKTSPLSASAPAGALPLCAITGRIAGDSDACGDCDPCGAAHKVPEVVRKLLSEKDDWRNKYAEAMHQADAPAWAPSEDIQHALFEIVHLSTMTPRRELAPGEQPHPASVALTKAEGIARSLLALLQDAKK